MRTKILSLLIFISIYFRAQNIPFEKTFFENRKDELKKAVASFQLGTSLYLQGRKEFEDFKRAFHMKYKYFPVSIYDYENSGITFFKTALGHLNSANMFNPNNSDLNYMIGFILFFTNPNSTDCRPYFEKAYALRVKPETDLTFWLGWNYQLNLQLQAKTHAALIEDVKKKIEECKCGIKLCENPERVYIENLGANVNSEYPEYCASITADEEQLFFTSRRNGSVGGKKDESDKGYFEDIYCSTRKNKTWQKPIQLGKKVNTEGHDAMAGLSNDGTKLFLYKFAPENGGDIYESNLIGTEWQEPKPLNKFINTKYHESSVSLSYDGKHLFFVSDKETGYGDRDIYMSDLEVNGEWGIPKNLGPTINTKYSEDGVFMHPDGVSLYFSSKGHGGMGGFDVFKSKLTDGVWSKPVNIGFPINSPNDDIYYVVNAAGNRAYISSAKAGGLGDRDIYKITFLGEEKKPLLNTVDQLLSSDATSISSFQLEKESDTHISKLTILKGVVRDEKTTKPLEAEVELNDLEKNITLATFSTNASSGKYLLSLPSGKNYGITIKCKGYLFHSENFDLPVAADYQEFQLDFDLVKIEIGKTAVLNNIFFDSGKSTLKDESLTELNKLYDLLQNNASIKIELNSYTDNVGKTEDNLSLSISRSESVSKYLVGKGIFKSRIISKGMGEQNPISKNDNEEGRSKNRRTEFKIVER
jgi:outer membrane protein OmpA-like peptidoglycan-associated protein